MASNDLAYAVTTDGFGNAYVAGSTFKSTIDASAKLFDWEMYVMKVNQLGTTMWKFTSAGDVAEISGGIAIHNADTFDPTVVVTGWFNSPQVSASQEIRAVRARAYQRIGRPRRPETRASRSGGGRRTDLPSGASTEGPTRALASTLRHFPPTKYAHTPDRSDDQQVLDPRRVRLGDHSHRSSSRVEAQP